MQGSYRTVRIVEIRNLFLGRLRHRVRAVEQQDRDLLVGLLADVHSAANAPDLLATAQVVSPQRKVDKMSPDPCGETLPHRSVTDGVSGLLPDQQEHARPEGDSLNLSRRPTVVANQ